MWLVGQIIGNKLKFKAFSVLANMDLQTSHLAAALMSGPSLPTYNNTSTEVTSTETTPPNAPNEEVKVEKPVEPPKDPPEEEKEEVASGEEYTDEVRIFVLSPFYVNYCLIADLLFDLCGKLIIYSLTSIQTLKLV